MKKAIYSLAIFSPLLAIITLNSCHDNKSLSNGEGHINVDGGKVWYRVVGNGDKTPILVVHGGPGTPSFYLKPLAALGTDRKIIFYDQLGCGNSDRINDTSLMNVDHFVEELKTVVNHFGLSKFYLYGQSWGTMLGTDYYLKYPEGIEAMILSSPAISIPMWMKDTDSLISTLPDSTQNAIRINEENKTFDIPAYQQAVQVFYRNFLARKQPWSLDIDSTFSQIGSTYLHMWGPSEFTATGNLKTYDRTSRLGEIKTPTLFIAGEFDEACPSTVKYYQSLVPDAKFEMVKGAAHMTMQDKPEENNKIISDFIKSIEIKK